MPRIVLIIFLTLIICLPSQSQTVGLVLSGGGAKGLAHVGVIEALEKNNIPIDYIAGTSIGAIVGGLYAIGYSCDEMRELLGSKQFYEWSYGRIDIQDQYYYKLKDNSQSWGEFLFVNTDKSLKPVLPTSIISPEQMDLRFMEFYTPGGTGANNNFDSLMIPFFCVATDAYRNKPHIMTSGDLAQSIRASMTFPGYFKAIEIDSILLFDGGMENNFPTNIMNERFKPDIIIGSKVAQNPEKPDSDDFFQQLENLFTKATDYNIPNNGILIEPDVKDYPLFDFSYYDELHKAGYETALKKIDSVKMLVSRRVSIDEVNKKREKFKLKWKPLTFQNIYVTGVDQQAADYILKNILRNRQQLTLEQFRDEYFKLLSDKLIKSIYPHCVYNKTNNNYDLYLKISTKNALTLKLGGNIASNLRNMGYVGIEYTFQKKNIYTPSANVIMGSFYNSFNGTFRMDFPPRSVKSDRVISPFYIDLSITHHNWNYFSLSSDWFVDNDSPAQFKQHETNLQGNIGRPINNRGLLLAGFSYGNTNDEYFHKKTIEREDIADQTIFDYTSLHLTYEYSTLNYREYYNNGKFINLSGRYITGSENYRPGTTANIYNAQKSTTGHSWVNLNGKYINHYNINQWFTIGYRFDINLTTKKQFSNSFSTLLSAYNYTPFPQSKVILLERYRAHTYAAVGISPIIKFTGFIDFRVGLYLFQPYKYIITKNFEPTFSSPFPTPWFMGSGALVFQSPLGPLSATVSYFHNEQSKLFFQINFGYLLFNKRGLD